MYLAPWQIFLYGCLVGILIILIVLSAIVVRSFRKMGVRGIGVIQHREPEPTPPEPKNTSDSDLFAKLSYILLNRGCISENDVDFLMDHISYEQWKKLTDAEIAEYEDVDDED